MEYAIFAMCCFTGTVIGKAISKAFQSRSR